MIIFLLCVSLFVVSADVFFVIQIGGFTFRLFQVLLAIVMAGAVWEILLGTRRLPWPLAYKWLLFWLCFMVAFTPNTSFLMRNIGYTAFLTFDVAMVFAITMFVDSPRKLAVMVKWYVYSFAFCALFGLFQFVLPLFGMPAPLVQEWWFPGIVARISGFSYEPSYYSTYMITGWVMLDYFRLRKHRVVPHMNAIFWLVTAALFLSTSRLGWAMMLTWGVIRTVLAFRQGSPVRWKSIAVVAAVVVLAGSYTAAKFDLSYEEVSFLANGLGILVGGSDYSSVGRYDVAKDTLQVFYDHPVVGVSLGGVATAVGHLRHSEVSDEDSAKENEGLCTTAEVLAASGIFGFIPYAVYMLTLIWTTIRCRAPNESRDYVRALGWGLAILLLALQFNQNILRLYLWLHIGILSAAYCIHSRIQSNVLRGSAAHRISPENA